ncbi:hypothetical protein LCGC14_1002520 [marine sediment metagenome]|uniref:Uncharacterized protein n=1 Tax=marine sediment metagenome TaxID=412755 RepID=A0A0F9N7D3_9ZZZZ|nr:hypothetical protein [Candidatus Aminicenantes bacterium]
MDQFGGLRERYKDVIEEKGKRIKRRIIFIIKCIALSVGIYLCFRWYDWELLVVVFVLVLIFSDNLNIITKAK